MLLRGVFNSVPAKKSTPKDDVMVLTPAALYPLSTCRGILCLAFAILAATNPRHRQR